MIKIRIGENPTSTEVISSSGPDAFLPNKIVELKTKYSKLGKVKKDGSRSFIVSPIPATASFNHVVQCAVYAAHWNFQVPVYLLYATQGGYQIFDSTNCKHLTIEGMKKNLQIKERLKLIPINRMAEPKEIAIYIKNLTTKENSYTTGQTITVAGGE